MSPIINYHGVADVPLPHAEQRYTVTEASFAHQLDALSSRPVVPLSALLEGRAPAGAVVLSFDDGEQSVARFVAPLLLLRGSTGVLYVTTDWIGKPGYCDEDDLRRLAAAGWEIGAHGASHRFFSDLDDDALDYELRRPRTVLRRILGRAPDHLSLPGGRGGRRAGEAARAVGYRSVATSVVPLPGSAPDPFALPRVAVQRSHSAEWVARVSAEDRLLLLGLRARQEILDAAKRLLGTRRYEAQRAIVSRLLTRST